MDFSIRLKQLRNEKQLTQEQLGKMLSFDKSTISRYESGKYEPSQDVLKLLSEFFGVTVDYLIGNSNVRYHHETIAAHHENDEWTEEELKSIEDFKEYIRSKRKKNE